MAEKMIPDIALKYIKNKTLKPTFSYKDVWNEEHATAFTVAKAMQIDILSDIKIAVEKAIGEGQSFERFKKELKPTLIKKGWWGRREMNDPLTGKTVNARLGSDSRLRTIYRTNLRSAYQKGQYERTMESDAHPYLMYCVGASVRHREQHLAWNGLILPKDDPWWNAHLPPNGWGCKCHTRAVSQSRKERYERDGILTAPRLDGTGGGRIPAKTERPKTIYRTFYNERKGAFERIPEGVTPGFNWNQGSVGREIPAFQECLKKAQSEMPEAVGGVMDALLRSKIHREHFMGFIDKSFSDLEKGKVNAKNTTAVGFLDGKVTKFLKRQGIDIGERNVIVLEQKLVVSGKYTYRHTSAGNAPTVNDWKNLVDYLFDAEVYWDGGKKRTLLFLKKISESRYIKIAVDPLSAERYLNLPKVDTMYSLDISAESTMGINEYNRIRKLEKIR
uniref:Phage head morphogenesis domain-containing protein n=1 Tax=uncultured Spirochaetaceae bacterium TaxID=201186 RepID=A0A650EPU4_9SPIO|nr:hypothetical protein Unknown280_0430 [uncultured Spirochaetaceae bacterium]